MCSGLRLADEFCGNFVGTLWQPGFSGVSCWMSRGGSAGETPSSPVSRSVTPTTKRADKMSASTVARNKAARWKANTHCNIQGRRRGSELFDILSDVKGVYQGQSE